MLYQFLAATWISFLTLNLLLSIKPLKIENCYGSGKFVNGNIVSKIENQDVHLGGFRFHYNSKRQQLYIKHSSNEKKILWSSVAHLPFISVANGVFKASGHDAMFHITDEPVNRTATQTIDSLSMNKERGLVEIKGSLQGHDNIYNYVMTFIEISGNQLQFKILINNIGTSNAIENSRFRIYLRYHSDPSEKYFGFGEQFTTIESSGECVPILVSENGVGRGLQPLSTIVNLLFNGAGGNPRSTYTGIPHYITSSLNSLFLENTEFAVFDLTRSKILSGGEVEIELITSLQESSMTGRILNGNSPSDLIQEYTTFSGRMKPLPDWILSGAVVGMQGGTNLVKSRLQTLLDNKVPVAALWLQDWTGKRQTQIGARLWWNWESDPHWYEGWEDFVDEMAGKNIRIMTYINPFLAIMDEKKENNPESLLHDYFSIAHAQDCLVKKLDGSTIVEKSATPEFLFGIVDLSTPKCKDWYKSIIQDNMLRVTRDSTGNIIRKSWNEKSNKFPASGWMADFGEYIPLIDAKLNSKIDPLSAHNKFPVWWANTCQEAIEEAGLSSDIVFFTRSGSAQTPKYSTLHWHGDQLPSWDEFDGLRSTLRATLSVGLSGYSLVHSDIGGYTTVSVLPGLINYVRDEELLFRWAELSSIGDSIFRTHEGLRPKKMVQVYDDDKVAQFFGKFANVHAAFSVYRKMLMNDDMVNKGLPLARHMFLHYWEDVNTHALHDQFLLGTEFLMAPVLKPQAESVRVYFPHGGERWKHLFNGMEYKHGFFDVEAKLGSPAIFYKVGSPISDIIKNELKERGVQIHS